MELIRFDETNAKGSFGRGKTPTPKLIIRNGAFLITKCAVELLKLKESDKVAVFQHPKTKTDWFIGKDKQGFTLRETKAGLVFNTSVTSDAIKTSVDCPKAWGLHYTISQESDFPGTNALVNKQVIPSRTKG